MCITVSTLLNVSLLFQYRTLWIELDSGRYADRSGPVGRRVDGVEKKGRVGWKTMLPRCCRGRSASEAFADRDRHAQ